MLPNVNITRQFSAPYQAQLKFDKLANAAAKTAGLSPVMVELIKIRVSQLNGCAFCLRMHTRDALAAGETSDRLAVLPAWWESHYFTAEEHAALTVAERVTRIGDPHAAAYSGIDATTALNDQQIAAVTWLAIVANGWTRIAISSRYPVAP